MKRLLLTIGTLSLAIAVSASGSAQARGAPDDSPALRYKNVRFDKSTGVGAAQIDLSQRNSNTDDGVPGSIRHKVSTVWVDGFLKVGKTQRLDNGLIVTRTGRQRLQLRFQAATQSYPQWYANSAPLESCTYVGTDSEVHSCLEPHTQVGWLRSGDEPSFSSVKSLESKVGITWADASLEDFIIVDYKSEYIRRGRMSSGGYWDCSIYYRQVCKWIPRKPGTPTVRREVKPLVVEDWVGLELEVDFDPEWISSYDTYAPEHEVNRGYLLTANGVNGTYTRSFGSLFRLPDTWGSGLTAECSLDYDGAVDCSYVNVYSDQTPVFRLSKPSS